MILLKVRKSGISHLLEKLKIYVIILFLLRMNSLILEKNRLWMPKLHSALMKPL